MLKEHDEKKKEIKNLKVSSSNYNFWYYYKKCSLIVWSVGRKQIDKIIVISKCTVCSNEKSRFVKEQEASGFLNSRISTRYSSKWTR